MRAASPPRRWRRRHARILIPPSVVLVIYAILAEQNIAKLFLAAFVPGIIAAVSYLVVIAIYVRLKPESAGHATRIPGLRASLPSSRSGRW